MYICMYLQIEYIFVASKKAGEKFLFLLGKYIYMYVFFYVYYILFFCVAFFLHTSENSYMSTTVHTCICMYACMPVSVYTMHIIQCHHLFISFAPMATGYSSSQCCLLLEICLYCVRVRRMYVYVCVYITTGKWIVSIWKHLKAKKTSNILGFRGGHLKDILYVCTQ